ncbi:hypothetical protein ALC56_10830 [Trachymyrmex septentrionalis]|uniref:Secreted protein n=1 Tax=Trachymyrmex septentrionalis TaxID=34720 RepID=A0A195F3W0_9HYME|nr:hypothetical protein ALC56_10830 [Trachymyrmex septentrionalis]
MFAFYFYLLGTIFLLLDSYAKQATKLPPERCTYNICHYHQVYLPEEAMALQTRGMCDREMCCLLEGVGRHHRKNVIHFIVDK